MTEGIRVGSGSVLLNHHSAFRVAETFRLLHATFPGRIDLGIGRANGYCVAGFINPGAVRTALDAYRQAFEPSPFTSGVVEPYTMVGINVSCGATEQEASRRKASVELVYHRLFRGVFGDGLATADTSVAELGGLPDPTRSVPGDWPRSISAAPNRLREMLESMAAEVGADEFILQDLIAAPADRQELCRLIAEVFELPAREMPVQLNA